ncbi:hypothetical protein L5M51_22055 [Shewanella sp. SM73]|uniref:hypothetical protein n=1 Tax=Shewanella sp. SM73 TaxID=2912806 RepID=UPI0021DAD91A|nr:hypothetical protein [Shewanella sp. SM73]MCU8032419.1 hypothetical protein [Shewanella sp. SM73]
MHTTRIAAAILLLSGCTSTLKTTVVTISNSDNAKYAQQGLVYYLPASSQVVTLTHKLLYCQMNKGILDFDYQTTATVKQTAHPDLTKVFVVDPEELHEFTKDWGMTVFMHPNGLLKSFATNADDKSIELGMAAVKTIVNIAAISQGIPISLASPPKEIVKSFEPKGMCIPELSQEPIVSVVMDSLTATVLSKTTELNKQQKKLAAAKGDTTVQEQAVLAAQKAVSQASLALEKFQKKITLQREYTYDTAKIADASIEITNRLEDFLPWVYSNDSSRRNYLAENMAVKYSFKLSIENTASNYLKKETTVQPKNDYFGLYYSTFGTRQLKLNRTEKGNASAGSLLFSGFITAPEFGYVAILPFKNHLGESNSFTANFDSSGGLTDVVYGTVRTGSEQVTAALYEATDAYNEYTKGRQTTREADKQEFQTLSIHALSIANSTYQNLTVDQLTARAGIVRTLLIKLGDTEQGRDCLLIRSHSVFPASKRALANR